MNNDLLHTLAGTALCSLLIPASLYGSADSGKAKEAVIRPGQVWLDSASKPINVHGGWVIFYDGIY